MSTITVVPNKQALVLGGCDVAPILAAVPTARQIPSGVAVPHKLDEAKVLNNIGFKVPSPIRYYYKWPGRAKPYAHQIATAEFLTLNKRAIVLNEIGTGKTKAALWAADYLMSIGAVKKVLVLSPLSTLERVWGDELFTGFPRRSFGILHGTADKRRKMLEQDYDVYVINHDGFPIIAKEALGMFDLVIVDEAAVLRNPRTQRFRLFNAWMQKVPECRLWLMTGTPTPNSPEDAWALAKLIGATNDSFTRFRDRVLVRVSQWTWRPRENAMDIVASTLTPAVRYTRDECLDLPDTVQQTRFVEMTAEQKKLYATMYKKLVAEVASGTVTAANEVVKAMKLSQIACGVVYDEAGNTIELDCSSRIGVVKEVIEEAGGKVIIFAPLVGVLDMLKRALGDTYKCEMVYGQVPAVERNRIFREFQHEDTVQVLLAHPATMAHGLTLTAAKSVIWYSPIGSNETYTQANGRTERIGKKHTTNVVHITATKLEDRMYARLASKQHMQGVLLDMIKQ